MMDPNLEQVLPPRSLHHRPSSWTQTRHGQSWRDHLPIRYALGCPKPMQAVIVHKKDFPRRPAPPITLRRSGAEGSTHDPSSPPLQNCGARVRRGRPCRRAVMMVYDRPPFAIVGRRSKGIAPDPKSLAGKKLGAPAADGAYAQWPIFKSVNALDDSTMTFANVGFPVREPMLASGEVDAVFGFSFSIVVNLRSRGVPGDDIVLMLMSDHGVELYGNVLMVSPKFAADHPEAVKGFPRALTKGLRAAVKDPATATASVIKRNDVAKPDVEKERLELSLSQNFVTPWVKANGYGSIDRARFPRAIDQIGLTFNFKAKPKVEDVFTEAFLPPSGDRKVD